MRLSDSVFVCLCATALLHLGCGPEPTAKQPNPSTSAVSTSEPAPSASPAASTTSSSSATAPVASAAPSASAVPTSSASASTPTGDTFLVGNLSNAEIQQAVNDNIKLFDACYTLGADKQGKFEATITIKVTVGPLGTVKDASLVKSTSKNTKVNTCVVDAFKKVKFPQPRGGAAIITYPMTFGGEVVVKK